MARSEAEAVKRQPPWELERVGEHRHRLRHRYGSETAYGVRVRGDYLLHADEATADQLGRGEAVDFMAARTGGDDRDETIMVHWYWSPERDGERQEWRQPLP